MYSREPSATRFGNLLASWLRLAVQRVEPMYTFSSVAPNLAWGSGAACSIFVIVTLPQAWLSQIVFLFEVTVLIALL